MITAEERLAELGLAVPAVAQPAAAALPAVRSGSHELTPRQPPTRDRAPT